MARTAKNPAPRRANTHSVAKSSELAEQYGKQAEATLRRAIATAEKGDKANAIALAMESTYLMGIADTHARYAGIRERNAYGWGAFLGSLAGTTLGSIFGLPGALAGSIGGAYYGGMHGLPSGRPSKKGAQWGAVGGVLGPITAGIAARVATDAGKSPNPQRTANRLKK